MSLLLKVVALVVETMQWGYGSLTSQTYIEIASHLFRSLCNGHLAACTCGHMNNASCCWRILLEIRCKYASSCHG